MIKLTNQYPIGDRVEIKAATEAKEQAMKTNEVEINNYNFLRKSKAFHDSNNRINFNSFKAHYQHLGNIMDLKSNPQQIKSVRPDLNLKESYNLPDSAHYRAADGTQYKYSSAKGFQTTVIDYPSKNVIHVPGKYHELYRSIVNSNEIPQNIRHKFGSNQTEQLLSDKLKVHDTLSFIQNKGIEKKHDNSSIMEQPNNIDPVQEELMKRLENNKSAPKLIGSDYYDLGHSICHGYPSINNLTTNKTSYTELVSKEHLSDASNIQSPFRRKKDWLGEWTEQSLVSKQVWKNLNKSYADKAKAKLDAKAAKS